VTTTRAGTDQARGSQAPAVERQTEPPAGDAEAVQPARVPGSAAEPSANGLAQLTRVLGTIVAPTTLLTSLLFYFGWSHAYWFFDYFGVNSTLLGLTTRDYVQRSLDGLFVPLTVVACAGVLVLWGHSALRTRLAAGSRPRMLRVLLPAMAIAGLVLAALGLWSVFAPTFLDQQVAAAPLCLASGVCLLVYEAHIWRSLAAGEQPTAHAATLQWAAVAEWAAVFVLVGLSLFWAANDYSAAVGRSRARQFVAELPTYPSAIVYSERSLSLDAPGVREVRCRDSQAAYRFRYDGLKLLLQSGDQYLFLPETWSPTDGVAIVVPKNDSVRLEFIPAAAGATVRRSTC
jgi:hypothetical protein